MYKVIKYRQPIVNKDGSFKEWFYWGDISEKEWVEAALQMNGIDTRRQSQEYVGLNDKNGNEIYEGDIVKRGNKKKVVKWVTAPNVLGFNIGNGAGYWKPKTDTQVEIIGNIYENQELLK